MTEVCVPGNVVVGYRGKCIVLTPNRQGVIYPINKNAAIAIFALFVDELKANAGLIPCQIYDNTKAG